MVDFFAVLNTGRSGMDEADIGNCQLTGKNQIKRKQDLVGMKFGRLTVVSFDSINKHGKKVWMCECSCGGVARYTTGDLNFGRVVSCGCFNNERVGKVKLKHGEARAGNMSSEYSIWSGILQRCTNKNKKAFKHYGGRGISVCERWMTFENFLEDMGRRPTEKHSIDRIDVNGNYEPGNCRWATDVEQARNARTNIKVTIDGVTKCLSEWAEINGVNYATARYRVKRGVDPVVAVTFKGRMKSHA